MIGSTELVFMDILLCLQLNTMGNAEFRERVNEGNFSLYMCKLYMLEKKE